MEVKKILTEDYKVQITLSKNEAEEFKQDIEMLDTSSTHSITDRINSELQEL
ncbi:hypothetical protein LCGC14_2166740 [marine sediment metagenome]|uniref:Uncharacterized protein n=1 Tax=marine sediment metagenome TaxID=412755 RepID=A0A0F9EDJ2_9ZZZZ